MGCLGIIVIVAFGWFLLGPLGAIIALLCALLLAAKPA
jgi:hypothetical protein